MMDCTEELNTRLFNRIQVVLESFAELLSQQAAHLSPQLSKRLAQVLSSFTNPSDVSKIFHRMSSLFQRVLLELIQAQYNTKQREQDVKRLIESKGCSIDDPELIDQIIEFLVRLYKAAVQFNDDNSFERRNLIKYIMKELGPEQRNKEKQVKAIIQTIYRCSCFHVTQQDGNPSRLKLKENLYDPNELRYKLDAELINIARANCIRLPPDSWAYLLHKRSSPENISQMQSILDKHISPIEIEELEAAIQKSGDKLCLSKFLDDLKSVQDLLIEFGLSLSADANNLKVQDNDTVQCEHSNNNHIDHLQKAVEIMEKLLDLKYLFVVRQLRSKSIEVHA
jgi:hypothetical protein